jgi:predicted extracellular nuclease
MKQFIPIALMLLMAPGAIRAQKPAPFTVAFYNTENLFDTLDDPGVMDEEFTPTGEKQWTPERYQDKLQHIARVLTTLDRNEPPALIGLAEVENRQVMLDLIQTQYFSGSYYKVIHENSPDERGIDVGLLYRPDQFEYLRHQSIPIVFPFEPDTRVRDILYVKGVAGGADTLHVFVNHWKSRSGGREATEQMRIFSARVLKRHTDSLLNKNPEANIVAMGDFNDEPANKSLHEVLGAERPEKIRTQKLYNLLYPKDQKGLGTYNYKYEWFMLDNLIVSGGLIKENHGYRIKPRQVKIFDAPWVMYENPKAGMMIPNRTYGGPNYFGGYSDHLAIWGTFRWKGKKQKK